VNYHGQGRILCTGENHVFVSCLNASFARASVLSLPFRSRCGRGLCSRGRGQEALNMCKCIDALVRFWFGEYYVYGG
jgi:hypothetical protein